MFSSTAGARAKEGTYDALLHRNALVHHNALPLATATQVPSLTDTRPITVDHTARAAAMELRVSRVYEEQQRLLAKETTLRSKISELLRSLEVVGPVLRERLCAQLSMHALVTRTAFPPSEGQQTLSSTEQFRRLLHSQPIRGRLCQFRDSPATLCDSLEASSFALLIPVLHEIVREETMGLLPRSRIPDILVAAVEVLHEASFRFSSAFQVAAKNVQLRALVVDLEACYRALCELRDHASIAMTTGTAGAVVCDESEGPAAVALVLDPPPRKKHRPDTPKQHDVSSSSFSSQGRSSGASSQHPAVGCRRSSSARCDGSLRTSFVSEEGRHAESAEGTAVSKAADSAPAPVVLRRLHDTIRRVCTLVEGGQPPDV